MGILLSILLIVLGLLAAETMIAQKSPPAFFKTAMDNVRPYQQWVGLAGLVMGGLGLLEWLSKLPYVIGFFPFYMLLSLAAILLLISLGLMFGLDPIRINLKDPTIAPFKTAEGIRLKLLPFQTQLGLASIVIGVVFLFLRF